MKICHTFDSPYESPKNWAVEFVEKEGMGALKDCHALENKPWTSFTKINLFLTKVHFHFKFQ